MKRKLTAADLAARVTMVVHAAHHVVAALRLEDGWKKEKVRSGGERESLTEAARGALLGHRSDEIQ